MPESVEQWLARIARRKWWQGVATRFVQLLLLFSLIFAVGWIGARLFGLWPDWFHLITLACLPPLALLVSLIMQRRVPLIDVARLADARLATKDLFLTSCQLERATGGYQTLVAEQSSECAGNSQVNEVLPARWPRRAWQAAAALLVLIAVQAIPVQLDPWGLRAAADDPSIPVEIAEQKAETEMAIEALRDRPLTEPNSAEVERMLRELTEALRQMRTDNPRENSEQLQRQQRELSQSWRQMAEQYRTDLAKADLRQRFGGISQDSRQLQQRLQQGDSGPMQERLEQLQQRAGQLDNQLDADQLQRELQQLLDELQQLRDAAVDQAGAERLEQALAQAMRQLEMACAGGSCDSDALAAALQSMELSQLELEALAQALRDMQSLEEALELVRLARQLNELEQMDGALCQGGSVGESLEAMRAALAELSADREGVEGILAELDEAGAIPGGQQAGAHHLPNQLAEREDPLAGVDTSPTQAPSTLNPGRNLMQWKVAGSGTAGEATIDYAEAVRQVQQGAAEAMTQQRVPPGYHEAIGRYFQSLERTPPADADTTPDD